jgi:hypothetical protein
MLDKRIYNMMPTQSLGDIYIKIHSLGPNTLSHTTEGDVVDWESDRGWFDELVPIYQRRGADLAWGRTDDDSDDSYRGCDFTEWQNIQRERKSMTLGLENYDHLDTQLPIISAIDSNFRST